MLLLAATLLALGPQGWFPFVIPWNDATHTVTDLSYLNSQPAGKNGRIVSRDGHFYESVSGNRVRFLAVNMVAGAAFPSHEDADLTAAHLAKLGVNLVRFHHLQNPWDVENGRSIWKKGRVYLDLDPVQVDKLDYLFAALKKHGIYSNINLQTTRMYLPEMGFPDSVKEIAFEMDKRIDKVDRKMIELQKQYARDLIGRVNRYTGLPYKQDPALAFVEINNENSLVGAPWEGGTDAFNYLPTYFKQEVVSGWNKWLTKRYGSDEKIQAAWSKGLEKPGPSILDGKAPWITENQSNGDVKFESPDPDAYSETGPNVAPSIRATVNSNSGPDWHVQIHLTGLNLQSGHGYTLRFRAKCSKNSTISAASALDEPDWHNVGLTESVKIGTEWQNYELPFVATDTRPNHNRVGFAIGAMRGVLEIDQLTLATGVDPGPILGGSLAKGTIPIPHSGIRGRTEDFYRFLTQTETAYSTEMRAFVRQELGVKSNLVDSQVAWGGLSSLIREKGSDYADNHSYWQHPSFPGKAWDTSNWLIGNTPMVDAMVNHSDGLSDLARFRFAGKPYTISEYNHPAPSDYRVEMMPLLSTFAAMQDWDGFYLFEYGVFGTGQKNDQIGGFFDIGLDPVRAGFLNSAALIFRSGYVRPLASSNLVVVPPEVAELGGSNAWSGHPNDPLSQRLAISSEGVTGITIGAKVNPVGWLKNADGAIFTVQEPKALVAVGHVANQALKLQTPGGGLGLSFSFGQFGRGFASVTCTPTKNGTYLLTIASRAENQGINWNGARTTIGADWGHGPVLAEGVPCDLVVSGVPVKHAWALDPTGRKARPIEVKYENGHATLHLSPADETIWYELMP